MKARNSWIVAALGTIACGGENGGANFSGPPAAPAISTVLVTAASSSVEIGKTMSLTAQARDASGNVLTGKSFAWASNADGVATVAADGVVTGLVAGTATITATSAGIAGNLIITVIPVPVSTVSISLDKPALFVGQSAQATASTKDANGNTITGRTVVWSTNDAAIASINSSGIIVALAAGTATVTGTSEGKSGTAAIVISVVPVASVVVSLASPTLQPGASTQASATLRDSNGGELTGRSVSWSSTNAVVVSVSSSGVVLALTPGTSTITATSEGKSGSIQVTVSNPSSLSITSIVPSTLIEGTTATINGTGFSGVQSVSIAGLPAPVTSASTIQLQVTVPTRDCQPERSESVVVTASAGTASSQARVKGPDAVTLHAGFFIYTLGDQCIRLAPSPAGSKFLVGLLSTSDVPSSLLSVRLLSSLGDAAAITTGNLSTNTKVAVSSVPVTSENRLRIGRPGGLIAPERSRQMDERVNREARVRESDAKLLRTLDKAAARRWNASRLSVSAGRQQPRSLLALGDTSTLHVSSTFSCQSAPTVKAVVRFVGQRNIWLEDVANPVTAFTTSEYQAMEDFYVANTETILSSYAGAFTDIDTNQHNLILITKEVNKQQGNLGFVWGGDLFPPALCPAGNAAEIFYGIAPDPSGTVGDAIDKASVASLYRSLMAHELTHIIQIGLQIYSSAGSKKTWELEGGATLSEQLVGFRMLGKSPGQDIGLSDYRTQREWFDWAGDLALYYGFLSSTSRASNSPEQCAWIGRTSEGNSGPCINTRAVYGVPATLLRFVLDRYGSTFPGGEAALMRNIVSSNRSSYSSLTVPTGVTTAELLSRFGIMQWSDGRTGNSFASWNLFDIWSGFVSTAHLSPYTSTSQQPSLDVAVRGGSTAFLEWSPALSTHSASLRIRTPSGAAPPTMVLWIYRYQ